MLGYVCKYTPVEIFESLGVEMKRIEPSVSNFNQADTLMHANICSFTKSVLEDVMSNDDYEGVILTTCCDSIRRLYDTLIEQFPDKFFYLLDIPRKVNDFAVELYTSKIREMISAYEAFSGLTFDEKKLGFLLQKRQEGDTLKKAPKPDAQLHIGLLGARCNKEIQTLLEDHHVDILFDLTCTGISRAYQIDEAQILSSYSSALLNQIPCMRMMKATNRENYVNGFLNRLDGIIYHTVKFCDSYSFEYAHLKETSSIPLLMVETDATKQCAGQIRTRIEAFIEALSIAKCGDLKSNKPIKRKGDSMYLLGIDSGSTSTNAVIIDEKENLIASKVIRTGAKSGESAQRILKEILEDSHLTREQLDLIVSTGYGRVSIPFADTNVTEISCHGKGAHFVNPKIRTILDIGGQDSKAIRLNENGEVIDFVMNDKCAAGTGRFLEMMARTLEISIEELGPISLQWKEDIDISSMCSVFAESEVISLIALNKEKADIAHGIHKAIANKSLSLLKRVGMEPDFMMTGGVAKNPGVVAVIEERLNQKLFIYEEPEIIGALGAAIFGLESLK